MFCTKGPPVWKRQPAPGASSAPLGDLKPGRTATEQRTPGGRSLRNSKAHSRSLIQRPLPSVAWASLQLSVSGAGALGSPKLTAASSNLATSCRTRATSPCGDRLVTVSACAPVTDAARTIAAHRPVFLLLFIHPSSASWPLENGA